MDKSTLNAQLVTTDLKRVFYHLRSVDCERSDLWKVLVWLSLKKNEWLDFAACQTCLQTLSRAVFQLFLQLLKYSEFM